MSAPAGAANQDKDWFRQPVSMTFWWVLPIVAANVLMNVVKLSLAATALVWAVAFAWMGTGCLLNARCCGRLHCFIAAPVLWLGAIVAGVVALAPGIHALNYVIWGTIALAILAFAPEWILGKYTRGDPRG